MSDRRVFAAAFLTAVLLVTAAFEVRQFFFFELTRSTIYIAIAVLVFFGEERYSYMLGIVAPVLWFIVDIVGGVFSHDFRVLVDYLTGRGLSLDTPLHALARLSAGFLVIVSLHARRKQVTERFLSKTFWTSLALALVYVGIVTAWYFHALPPTTRMP